MRRDWILHAPTLAVFIVMLLLGGLFGIAIHGAGDPPKTAAAIYPLQSIDLPVADQDRDGYSDALDVQDGDRMLAITVDTLHTGQKEARPYMLLGSHDDQWRFGAGRELTWRHVVDPDPFGLDPGSQAWSKNALRTGVWIRSLAAVGQDVALGEVPRLDPDSAIGTEWPHTFLYNVRDDIPDPEMTLELWDQRSGEDALLGRWTFTFLQDGNMTLGDLEQGPGVHIEVHATTGLRPDTKHEIAERWAPRLHFAQGEGFTPTAGETFLQYHGFERPAPDLQTWLPSFNNGVDHYRLLVADFDGDGDTDHQDVTILTDILRAGGTAPDTVNVHVFRTTGDRVVVQYWFLYLYNFVLDETGRDIDDLAHSGDREFIQLVFRDLASARAGLPESISYSQHYGGIRIDAPRPGQDPLLRGTSPEVYVARGSHASFPVPGDDDVLRGSFVGYRDEFPGDGEQWAPDDYTLELMQDQEWLLGYKWGPTTRYHRALGVSASPLLKHDFQYPWHDPINWADGLEEAPADGLRDLYGSPEEP